MICAIATAPGCGAIAVIRVSGEGSIELVDKVFVSPSGKRLVDQAANTIHYGELKGDDGETLDYVMVSVFRTPHSFTGEDSVEISCHGSRYIQSAILKLLIANGASMAMPGEFTKRAFLNGKMDLSQAEAVADVIASNSRASLKMAMNQMRGGFSRELQMLRDKMLNLTSLLELELDFSEEDVEFADRAKLSALTAEVNKKITSLCNSFSTGNAIKNGVPVAIVGPANAGKSTLLNYLLKEDKAIVSEIAGTTRDVIEDTVTINGITFRFIDTAGIRATSDRVESLGIERTFAMIAQAKVVLLLFPDDIFGNEGFMLDGGDGGSIGFCGRDAHEEYCQMVSERMNADAKLIIIHTKIDKERYCEYEDQKIRITDEDSGRIIIRISAKTGEGIDALIDELTSVVDMRNVGENDVIVSNMRHYEALSAALVSIERVEKGLQDGIPGDLVAQDLRECLYHLGTITGQINTDEILGNIFKNFCIGK